MESFAISVLPVARPGEWRSFAETVVDGERAEDHRAMLRRMGVQREHISFQQLPGDRGVAVLVWEGLDQGAAAQVLIELVTSPQSEHERFLAEHVIPVLHGIDVSHPPPAIERVATIDP